MEIYSKLFYTISKTLTQGCIIPIKSEYNIIDPDVVALLIIENACNLVEDENRSLKVTKIEYINLYNASEIIQNLKRYDIIQEFIQNRRFSTETIFLPPHNKLLDFPDGFNGDCKSSGFISFETLNAYEDDDYLCIKPPSREYINNKIIQFKLAVPIESISDEEAINWIFERYLIDGSKSYQELIELKPKKMSENKFKSVMQNLTENQIVKRNKDGRYELYS